MRLEHEDNREHPRENLMTGEAGVIKYGIAYLLGVPLSLLVLIFLVSRGC
jgi:hypothetical protein